MRNNLVHTDIINSKFQPPADFQHQGNNKQLKQFQCQTQYRQFSFLFKTIQEWNELQPEIEATGTLDAFCGKDHHHHHHQSLNRKGCWGTTEFCNQFSLFFHVLHCPVGLAKLQACSFPDVVFPPLPLSLLSSSPFHSALQDGFGQT